MNTNTPDAFLKYFRKYKFSPSRADELCAEIGGGSRDFILFLYGCDGDDVILYNDKEAEYGLINGRKKAHAIIIDDDNIKNVVNFIISNCRSADIYVDSLVRDSDYIGFYYNKYSVDDASGISDNIVKNGDLVFVSDDGSIIVSFFKIRGKKGGGWFKEFFVEHGKEILGLLFTIISSLVGSKIRKK